jgi:hypothetical protein
MATQLFANSASALLAASINDTDLTIQVATGFGTLYPNPGAQEYFLVTLENADGDREICRCSARTSDLLTVTRGQDGTTAQSWTAGQTRVEARLTKGTMENFLQKSGGEMSGDLDMNGNDLTDPVVGGSGAKWTAGEIYGTPIRGATGLTANQILVPDDGSRATAGGANILVAGDDLQPSVFETGMIMLWYGAAIDVPTGWAICDGSSGTPDMRDRFPVGVSGTKALGTTGGAASASTSSSGGHDHGGATGSTAITEAQMPAHTHEVAGGYLVNGNGTTDGIDGGPQANAAVISTPVTSSVGGGGGHTHTITAESNHNHSVDTLPPYRALYFIMRL